jgi:uncharacterized sulfatase
LLRDAGYYCGNNGKTDYNFPVPQQAWDDLSDRASWRNRREGQPFFCVFNLFVTHESQIRASDEVFARLTNRLLPEEHHTSSKVLVPPFQPDTPVVRRDMARFADLVTAMDYQVGDLLTQLERDGLADDTIVMFFSDHGTGLPRIKQWNWDCGMRVPLIVRYPEKYQDLAPSEPGTTSDRLVSFVDFAPTVLGLAGANVPEWMQGSAFLGARMPKPREYIYGMRDRMDERYDMQRTVRDKHYKYFRNYYPYLPYAPWLTYMEEMPTMQEWRRLQKSGELSGASSQFMRTSKPVEELFDIEADPNELQNLAGDEKYQSVLHRMREAHFEWSRDTRDLGLLPEDELETRPVGTTAYEMAHNDPQSFPIERIIAAARLTECDVAALPKMSRMLLDSDAAVRYWAAIALANLAADAAPAADALKNATTDSSPSVRIAAAEALSRIGMADEALPVLKDALLHQRASVRLQAANVVDRMGLQARPLLPVMKEVASNTDPENLMVRWVLEHSIRNASQ